MQNNTAFKNARMCVRVSDGSRVISDSELHWIATHRHSTPVKQRNFDVMSCRAGAGHSKVAMRCRTEITLNTDTAGDTPECSCWTDVANSGGLAHRETGRFPGGPLLQEFFRAPSRTRELISLIIS